MDHSEEIAALRHDYRHKSLDEKDVARDPLTQFTAWWTEAVAGKLPEPNAMAIATADASGSPSVRMVLLKQFDQSGFCFYTNYQSQKGKELAQNPKAALLFFWVEFERQVRIEGTVEKLSHEDSEKYFQSRPRGAQLGAIVSPQSEPIASRAVLETKLKDFETQHPNEKVTCPEHWGGYRVVPQRFEFWQGRSDRLHDRVEYQREKSDWRLSRLSP